MGRPKKIKNEVSSGIKATVTTETFNQPIKEEKEEKATPKKLILTKCGYCNKDLDAFVVGGGIRFCSDDCLKEYFK